MGFKVEKCQIPLNEVSSKLSNHLVRNLPYCSEHPPFDGIKFF